MIGGEPRPRRLARDGAGVKKERLPGIGLAEPGRIGPPGRHAAARMPKTQKCVQRSASNSPPRQVFNTPSNLLGSRTSPLLPPRSPPSLSSGVTVRIHPRNRPPGIANALSALIGLDSRRFGVSPPRSCATLGEPARRAETPPRMSPRTRRKIPCHVDSSSPRSEHSRR